MKPSIFAIALLSLAVPALHAQLNNTDPPYQTLCRAALAKPFAPPPADPGLKPDCDATAAYFGIGRPVDYTAARACAFAEYAQPEADNSSNIFFGAGILSMIYANGQGTPADLGLAVRFTCEKFAAPAEIETRLDALNAARDNHTAIAFDLCDTATSGNTIGWCTSIEARLSTVDRNKKLDLVRLALPAAAAAPFAELQKAEDEFLQLHIDNEIDRTGSYSRAAQLADENDLRDRFLADLQAVILPSFHEDTAFKAADKRLAYALKPVHTAVLKSRLPRTAKTIAGTTIAFKGIEDTQQAWLRLRDAWITFVRSANPAPKADTQAAALLTMERAQQLEEVLHSADPDQN
jgi:uncharacterized protein YecT (DUF1311 family)